MGCSRANRVAWVCLAAVPAASLAGNRVNLEYVPETGPVPALHISRVVDHASERRILQARQEMCIDQITTYREQAKNDPQLWRMVEETMQDTSPGFLLNRALEPVKDWSKVARVREEEYFDHGRYAYYRYWHDYRIAEDGTCGLRVRERASADIDDGRYRYVVNLTARRAFRYTSPVVSRAANDGHRKAAGAALPELWPAVGRALFRGAGSSLRQQLHDAFEMKGREIIAREWCDLRSPKGDDSITVCAWSRTAVYPGPVGRPVILWWRWHLGGDVNEGRAVTVRRLARVPDEVFRLPGNVRINPPASVPNTPGPARPTRSPGGVTQ